MHVDLGVHVLFQMYQLGLAIYCEDSYLGSKKVVDETQQCEKKKENIGSVKRAAASYFL